MNRPLVALVTVLAIVAGFAPGFAHPDDDLTEIEQQIEELNAGVEVRESERSAIQSELAGTAARMAVLREQLAQAEAKVQAVEAEIAAQEAGLAATREQLSSLRRELAVTRIEQREARLDLRDRAVEAYMERSLNLGGVFLSARSVADFTLGIEYADRVLQSIEELVRALEALEDQERRQETDIASREEAQEQMLASFQSKRADLDADRALVAELEAEVHEELHRQQELLARVKRNIAEIEGEIAALERDAERIRAAIIAAQQDDGEAPGVLLWPVNGTVTSGFGYRVHPITGMRKLHTGIDISAPSGTPIAAAGSGVVILAQFYGGYGNTIVIDHGGGLTSLYAHQSSLAVSVGRSVTIGDTIGFVGSTGFSTGPHLHFETREFGTPVDPMKYLSG